MIQELNQVQLQNIVEELLDWDALELQVKESEHNTVSDGSTSVDGLINSEKNHSSTEVLFPYLMNDATEYFVRLKDCQIQGSWCGDKKGILSVTFEEPTESAINEIQGLVTHSAEADVKTVNRKGLFICQNDGTTLSIHYRIALEEMHCYQYHRIGHNWRKEPGQERIRRLVNLLCVLHDKCSYLDDRASTETERQISLLMEFQPLCYWTPINSSIEEWYPESLEGIYAMENLAEEAGDSIFLELLKQYRIFWENYDETLSGKRMQKQLFKLREKQSQLQRALIAPEHVCLLDLLEQKIEKESLHWEPRVYTEDETARMEEMRKAKEAEYRKLGFEGSYPRMYRPGNKETASRYPDTTEKILFVEEQPFTELEWSDYQFRIYEIPI